MRMMKILKIISCKIAKNVNKTRRMRDVSNKTFKREPGDDCSVSTEFAGVS